MVWCERGLKGCEGGFRGGAGGLKWRRRSIHRERGGGEVEVLNTRGRRKKREVEQEEKGGCEKVYQCIGFVDF